MSDYQVRLEIAFGRFIWPLFMWENGVSLELMNRLHHLTRGHASRRTIAKLRKHFAAEQLKRDLWLPY